MRIWSTNVEDGQTDRRPAGGQRLSYPSPIGSPTQDRAGTTGFRNSFTEHTGELGGGEAMSLSQKNQENLHGLVQVLRVLALLSRGVELFQSAAVAGAGFDPFGVVAITTI